LKGCQELSWLVIESDSSDKTLHALQTLSDEIPRFRFISLGNLKEAFPLRTQRIAHCRNAYLEELRSNPLYSGVEYLVVADLDGNNDLVTPAGFASCWKRADWGACTANQRGPYYDILALRHSLWSPNDCQKQCRFLFDHGVDGEAAEWAAIFSRMITIDEAQEWIEVDSAFGGLGIYRREVLDGVSYVGVDEAGAEIAEHVALNYQIRSKGHRIFINPQLINTSVTPHNRERFRVYRTKGRFVDLLRTVKWSLHGEDSPG
jgi:hypothetical protein